MPRRSIHTARLTALAICCLAPLTVAATARAGDNDIQGLGPVGTATMHGDAQSSDTTIHPGPGHGPLRSTFRAKAAACPTILADSQGRIWSLCTEVFGRAPVVNLLDAATGDTLASLPITKGALLGGVYAYLDDADRLVLVDGSHHLRRIGVTTDANGRPSLSPAASLDLSAFVTGTGATPTFLGPDGSDEYVTITDNADGQEHLLVLRTADGSTV